MSIVVKVTAGNNKLLNFWNCFLTTFVLKYFE